MTTPAQSGPSTKPMDAPQTLEGRVLDGRFRLDEVINTGGMGIIFKATQLNISRVVAVKVLRPTLSSDYDLMRRFSHEVDAMGRLTHPNIVSLVDSGQDTSGLQYLVMEYVEGDTLRDALRQCKLTLIEILGVFAQTCDALIEAHEHGIIHRDLKFDNIMVRRLSDGRLHVQILDFGVAKQLTKSESVTRSGEVPGTPGIIAPELVDNGTPSPRSDLYSLGILLFTSLTGEAPFQGQNDLELMRAHKLEEIPNLYELVGDRVPEEIIELVFELMQKDPERRPSSATGVRDRLETIARNLRKQRQDLPRYIPPRTEKLQPLEETDEETSQDRSIEFLAAGEDNEEQEHGWRREPIVAPASIVALLISLLLILVLIIIYLLYKQFVGAG